MEALPSMGANYLTMLIIGSYALAYYTNIGRMPTDVDVVCSEWEFHVSYPNMEFQPQSTKVGNVEFHNSRFLNNSKIPPGDVVRLPQLHCYACICPLDYLAAIKRSHLHRPLSFAKHMHDYNLIKDQVNMPVTFLAERVKLTKQAYPDKVPSLAMSNDDFFDDPVKKIYVHDDLHEIVAFGDVPVYTKMKHDAELAMCAKDLWDKSLSHKERIHAVQEEAMVIALERFIIPYREGSARFVAPRVAFLKAIEKICTTLTSGWFRDFAIDNYREVISDVPDFVSIFEAGKHKCRKNQPAPA